VRVFEGGEAASTRARQAVQGRQTGLWVTTDRDGVKIGWLYGSEERLTELGRVLYSRTVGRVFVIAQVGTEHQHLTLYGDQLRTALHISRLGEVASQAYGNRR